jgi:Na+/H+ antiporter NhaD/arsenite permease-like protein
VLAAVALRSFSEFLGMNAVIGVLLLAAATVLFSWAYSQLRRPSPRAWARWDVSAQIIVFIWVAATTSGIGLLAMAISAFDTEPPTGAQYSAIAATVVAAFALRYLLKRQWRRLQASTSAPLAVQQAAPPAQDGQPPSRTPKAA